jgi:hypothetical protein
MKKYVWMLAVLALFVAKADAQVEGHQIILVPAEHGTIQAAINASSHGDLIQVSAGTYTENIDFSGKDITIQGMGASHTSIINGNQTGSCVTIDSGERVATLIGFSITNGSGNALVHTGINQHVGGGICCINSGCIIDDCLIYSNEACEDVTATQNFGGGIYAQGRGYHLTGTVEVKNCKIYSNKAGTTVAKGEGGGVYYLWLDPESGDLVDNEIYSNEITGWNGTGVYISGGIDEIDGNVIYDNSRVDAEPGAYAVYINSISVHRLKFTNNLIYENDTNGVFFFGHQKAYIYHNTISDHNINIVVSALASDFFQYDHYIYNNIFYNYTTFNAGIGHDLSDTSYHRVYYDYNCTEDGNLTGAIYLGKCIFNYGSNNIAVDPEFVDKVNDDYHIDPSSPCVDTGDPTRTTAEDFEGDDRGDAVDIGADEDDT